MDTNNQEIYEETPVRKKKGKIGLIIFLVVVILAIAAGVGYYFMERQKPISATKDFLENVRAMNIDGIKNLVQDEDTSALDSANITSDAYSAFFTTVNSKMTYKITKTDFQIQNGTAYVTAHIKYIDGSDIYKEAITDFLKEIVSTTFSGTILSEEETQQKLASALEEKSASVEDTFAETDITYPLVLVDGKWKITIIDDETVKVMSANFSSVKDEINSSVSEATSSDSTDSSSDSSTMSSTTSIDMENEYFTLKLKNFEVTQAVDDTDCILIYCDYTNNSDSSSSAFTDLQLSASQNGTKLSPAVPKSDVAEIDNYLTEVASGSTVTVCYAFSLNDKSDVTLEASEAFAFGDGTSTSQTISIQ